MDMMNAVRAHRRGGPDGLVLERAPIPRPAEDEALVEVHAAAVTYDELLWDESWTRDGADRTPIIPSHEVSGTVAVIGAGVTEVRVGDDVYGLIAFDRDGAAADYVAVTARDLARKPHSVSHVEAASLPLAALTAWQALVEHAGLRSGDSVLVLGASGGVGGYAVQLARHLGARVTASVRTPEDVDYVLSLGADHFVVGPSGPSGVFDVVIDTIGGDALPPAYSAVRTGGRLVTLSAPPPAELRGERDLHEVFFIVRPDREQLEHLADLVDSGVLRTLVASVYDLSDARSAYRDRGRHGGPGKTVLAVRK